MHESNPLPYRQIEEQYQAGHQEPIVLVKRTSGDISIARLSDQIDSKGRRMVRFTDQDGLAKKKPVTSEALTDEIQWSLASELGEGLDDKEHQRSRVVARKLARTAIKNQLEASQESLEGDHLAKLARPLGTNSLGEVIPSAEDSAGPADYYDLLFGPDRDLDSADIERAAIRTPLRDQVKPENISQARQALGRLMRDDEQIESIISQAVESGGQLDIDALRTDPAVRSEVLRHLIDRLNRMSHLASDRVRNDNYTKTINYGRSGDSGYPYKVSSREATALLALSMLDGSFDGRSSQLDPVRVTGGNIELGQHRYAALQLLDLESSARAKEFVGVVYS